MNFTKKKSDSPFIFLSILHNNMKYTICTFAQSREKPFLTYTLHRCLASREKEREKERERRNICGRFSKSRNGQEKVLNSENNICSEQYKV